MAGVVNPRRRYHSPLRVEQAEQTRRRILSAARQLFVERGFTATTVAAVAQAAGVSPDTIYVSLGGKRGLLEGVLEMAISGLDDPSAMREQRLREEMGSFPILTSGCASGSTTAARCWLEPARFTRSSGARPTATPSPRSCGDGCSSGGWTARPRPSGPTSTAPCGPA